MIKPPQDDPKKEIILNENLELALTPDRMGEWFNHQLSVNVGVDWWLNSRSVSPSTRRSQRKCFFSWLQSCFSFLACLFRGRDSARSSHGVEVTCESVSSWCSFVCHVFPTSLFANPTRTITYRSNLFDIFRIRIGRAARIPSSQREETRSHLKERSWHSGFSSRVSAYTAY